MANKIEKIPKQASFKALGAYQSIATTAATKVTYSLEQHDTTADYDPVTNYRWTPSVAGKCWIGAGAQCINVATGSILEIRIYKNGSAVKSGWNNDAPATSSNFVDVFGTFDCNGSTDYFEVYILCDDGSYNVVNTTASFFEGFVMDEN